MLETQLDPELKNPESPTATPAPTNDASELIDGLISGRKKVGIWGLGYLGYHNLVRLITRHIGCVVADRDADRCARVASSGFVERVLQDHYGFAVSENGSPKSSLEVTDENALAKRDDVAVHLICVPNEVDGRPTDEPLWDAVNSLAAGQPCDPSAPVLWVLESSGEPGAVDRIVLPTLLKAGLTAGRDVCIGCAPRIDYGQSPFDSRVWGRRVAGGVTARCGQLLTAFYESLGQQIRLATTHREAELACAVHRGSQQLLTSYATQLALAFAQTDMREVIELAGTIGSLRLNQPALGSSGYFLPLSANHVCDAASHPQTMTLLDEAVRSDLMIIGVVKDRIAEAGVERVAVLGLSAVADLKNHIHSPGLKLVAALRAGIADTLVCDPLYTNSQINKITGCEALEWPGGLERIDGLVLVTAHRDFLLTDNTPLAHRLANMKLVLDCSGGWVDKKLRQAGVNYFALGEPGWMQ